MQKIKVQFLKLFYISCLVFATNLTFGQTINTVAINPTSPTDCTPWTITADGTLWAINIQFLSMSYSVNGSVIDVSVNFDNPAIILPAIGSFNHSTTLNNISAGTYTVNVTSYQGSNVVNTVSTSVTITSCCPANASITANSNFLCVGDSLTLTSTSTNATSISWIQNGNSLSSNTNLTIAPTAIGTYTYTLEATDGACTDTANWILFVDTLATFDLGMDTSFCEGGNVVLDATIFDPNANYSWQGTNITSGSINADTSGTYIVNVTLNACSGQDSVNVIVFPNPTVDLGPEILGCFGDVFTLDATAPNVTYLWSTGDTTATLQADTSNIYSVTLTDINGCTASDDISVFIKQEIILGLIPNDTIFIGDSLVLDAGGNYASYLWSTGDDTSQILVFDGGTYTVTVTDNDGCQGSDSTVLVAIPHISTSKVLPEAIRVYPNPATDFLHLDLDNIAFENTTAIISNGLGQQIKSIQLQQNQPSLDISELAEGVYYLSLFNDKNQPIGIAKFIKL